jgi:hypothetical protein
MEIFFLLGCLVRLMEGNPPLFASEIGDFVSEKSLHGGGETVCREGVEGRYELENCTAYRWCKSHAYGCSRIPTKGTTSLPFFVPPAVSLSASQIAYFVFIIYLSNPFQGITIKRQEVWIAVFVN